MTKMEAWEILSTKELSEWTRTKYDPIVRAYYEQYGESTDPMDVAKFVTQTDANVWPIRALRSYMRLLSSVGLAPPNILRFIPAHESGDPAPIKIPKPEHIERLLMYLPDRIIRTGVILMTDGGLRHSEVVQLRWKHVDFERGRLTIYGKGRKKPKMRIVPILTERLRQHLVAIYNDIYSPESLVIPPPHPPITRHRNNFLRFSIRRASENARRKGHWVPEGIHPHLLRHYFAVQCTKLPTSNLKALQLVLGHSNIATTDTYLQGLVGDQNFIEDTLSGIDKAISRAYAAAHESAS